MAAFLRDLWLTLFLVSCFHLLGIQGDTASPGFIPGCSFVGGQCMYTVKLGHQGQCESVQSGTSSSECCSSLRREMDSLESKFAALEARLNKESSDSELKTQVEKLKAENAALQSSLQQKVHQLQVLAAELRQYRDSQTTPDSTTSLSPSTTTTEPQTSPTTKHIDVIPPTPDFCNLNDLGACGYKLVDPKKYEDRQYKLEHVRVKGPKYSSGPNLDHTTGTSMGGYVILDTRSYKEESRSGLKGGALESKEFPPAPNYCIKFWYSLYSSDAAQMSVFINVNGQNGNPVYTRSGRSNVKWQLGEVSLDSEYASSPFKVQLMAYTDYYYHQKHIPGGATDGEWGTKYIHGNIAFDDIYVYNTSCSAIPKCLPNAITNTINNVTSCYTFHTTPKPWKDAYDTCRREGAESSLVSIESKEEQKFLVQTIKSNPEYLAAGSEGFYTSGSDDIREGKFVWTDNNYDQAMPYTNWRHGQPNNVGGEQNCLLLEYPEEDFVWDDYNCDVARPFICEVHK